MQQLVDCAKRKHSVKDKETSSQEVCRFFLRTGNCKFGSSCRRLHPPRSSTSTSTSENGGGSWRRVGGSSSSSSSSWRSSSSNEKRSGNSKKKYYTGSASRQDTTLRPMLDFHNHVKRTLYRKFIRKNSTVLELAGGRGGDLWKLRDCGVSEVRILSLALSHDV